MFRTPLIMVNLSFGFRYGIYRVWLTCPTGCGVVVVGGGGWWVVVFAEAKDQQGLINKNSQLNMLTVEKHIRLYDLRKDVSK